MDIHTIINKINDDNNDVIVNIKNLDNEELVYIIKYANDYYYNSDLDINEILITDEIYDLLKEELELRDSKHVLAKQIGSEIMSDDKVVLPYHMGSMDKIKNDPNTLAKWLNKYKGNYVISDKLDGISALLYKTKKGIELYSRGNGTIGKNLNKTIDHLKDIQIIDITKMKEKDAIRGELIMKKRVFLEKYKDKFKNGRNLVSGIFNKKNPEIDMLNDVEFVVYEYIDHSKTLKPEEQFDILTKLKCNVVFHKIVEEIGIDELHKMFEERKQGSLYEIDGIIVSDNNKHKRNTSGNPSYGFAYKGFIGEIVEAEVSDIVWRVSKDRYIIPTVHIKPIEIGNVTVSKLTGFNAKFIKTNHLGPGSIIKVIRSGDVIPYIQEIVKHSHASLPKDIPYKWTESGVHIIYDGQSEPNKQHLINELVHFFTNIETKYLNEGTLKKLVDNGFDSIVKIIDMNVDDFMKIEGFQKKMATKIYESIQQSIANVDLISFMVASNKFGRLLSYKKIKKVLDEIPNVLKVKNMEKLFENIKEINGFEEKSAKAFIIGLENFHKFMLEVPKHTIDIDKLLSKYKKEEVKGDLFKGMNVVFTGFRNKEMEKYITENGGVINSTVTSKTTLLVKADDEETSGKITKANSLGVEIITLSEFKKQHNLK